LIGESLNKKFTTTTLNT